MKLALLFLFALPALFAQPQKPWPANLDDCLRTYGHRNWIVIADSAYPLQSNPGIETVLSGENQVETVRHVLAALAKTPHLRPIVHIDKELNYVSADDAPGIGAYRQLLTGMFETYLPDQKPSTQLHEQIIRQLDEAAKTFNVLIIKTNMALPYTSVFIELRAGYWTDDAERRMRENMK